MPIVHDALDTLGRAGGFVPRVRLVADGIQAQVALVAAGVGAAIVPASAVPDPVASRVVLLPVDSIDMTMATTIAYSPRNSNPLLPATIATVGDVLRVRLRAIAS